MAYAGQTLDNPISGERIIFRQTAADTDGELLEIDLVLAPDGHVPGAHVHPLQEERFEVMSGTMKFRLGRKKIIAHAGDVVVVPAGSAHRFANAGDEPAHVRVEVRPALKMEQLFETTVELARDGRTNRKGMPKPLDLALFVREYEDEVRAPFPPAPIVKATMAPLVWIAKHRGLAERYMGATLSPAPAV
jgi:quercetin dioxygenase-like cupin family protein